MPFTGFTVAAMTSSSDLAVNTHSPHFSSAQILMDGMTHLMRLYALVADMMTVDQVDERMNPELVGGGCHRG